MGVSSRATRVIEPASADLLMPDRIRRASAPRMRDVEDACFETLGNPRDVFAPKTRGTDHGGVFKSRIGQLPSHGPFPRDYATPDQAAGISAEPRERLGVFAKNAQGFAAHTPGLSPAACGFVLALCAATAAAFWMAGGHVRVAGRPATMTQVSAPPAAAMPAPPVGVKATPSPDPMTTSSITKEKTDSGNAGYWAPMPPPARIERAGSILMIRPGGG